MKTFEELELIPSVQQALTDLNYNTPTPIQAQTIPAALDGRDILGCAQTGTGKTAAFALPILDELGRQNRKAPPNQPFALILAPTRELAIQIGESFTKYGKHIRVRQALVYGGVSQANQVRALKRGAHVLVATPGRLLDLMNQGHIKLDRLEAFVLDEADRMLDMGFLPDLKRIISELPEQRQSLFFSATLPPKITELSRSLLRDPVTVNVTPKTTSVEKIEQRVMHVERKGKQALLKKIILGDDVDRVLVFTKTKRAANMLSEQLVKSGMSSTAIHGNKSQAARQRALLAFRRKQVQILVATDVAARGIDIDGITHVINFDLPLEAENYVHRIGRTGRAGAKGIALSFCSSGERRELFAIEKLIGQKIPVDPDQPEPARGEYTQSSRPPRRRFGGGGGGGGKRPGGAKRPFRRHPASTEGSSEGEKPKRRRRPKRKVRPQTVKQSS